MSAPPFRRVLIANRGEIALRVIRSAREMGIESVAVYSDADRDALHVRHADRAAGIGPPPPTDSYLRIAALVEAARAAGCDSVHPGYGFLSENAAFAEACAAAGLTFVGPPAEAIRRMGDKVEARRIAQAAGVPLVPGLKDDVRDDRVLESAAAEIGYPVMLKAAAGGGGKGIRIVERQSDLVDAARLARAEARTAFGDDRIYLEKYVTRPRHVEIQVMADRLGNVVAFGERECSVQRRHQKLIEESPCPVVSEETRVAMQDAACRLARSVGYVGAGTVEFLWSDGDFWFLEMNTRLQVEHPITEERFGVDLVREQFRVAAGLPLTPPAEPRGHAIEVRINAEDPDTFFPSTGVVQRLDVPGGPGVRLDSAVFRGMEITPFYDSMLGKLIVHAADRESAIRRMLRALRELRIVGVATSVPVALRVLESPGFLSGDYDTSILDTLDRSPPSDTVELAALAAALGRFVQTEPDTGAGRGSRCDVPLWTLIDRVERLGGRPR